MREVLNYFQKKEPNIDLFLQSPLIRCQETGDILREYYPKAHFVNSDHLRPDHSAEKLFEEIQQLGKRDAVGLIGHEPDLGQFISWLLFGRASDHFPMKKAGIAKLDIYGDGRRHLKWMLRPNLIIPTK